MTTNQLKYWELKESERHNTRSEDINAAEAATNRYRVQYEARHWMVSDLTGLIKAVGELAGPLSGGMTGAIMKGGM